MYDAVRRLLFRLDPERVHHGTLRLLQAAGAFAPLGWALERVWTAPPAAPVEILGLTFPNRIGLAAGFDKDGLAWRGLARLGFGHIEVGTVTPQAQPGNPRPRLFRLDEDRAVINRMGFPGRGADFVAHRLGKPRPSGTVIGVNLGRSRTTPNAEASGDYTRLLATLAPLADFVVVNVSSPNTPGLRDLQAGPELGGLLAAVTEERNRWADRLGKGLPVLVKLSPDLGNDLENALDAIVAAGIDGVIAANTTVRRPGLCSAAGGEPGGLSGAPLRAGAAGLVRRIRDHMGPHVGIVASGGVMSAADAVERLEAGADLVQVYTGLIFEGPALVAELIAATAASAVRE